MFDQAKIVASTSSRWLLNPSYMHTFGITKNYFIIIEQPFAIDLIQTLNCIIKNNPMRGCLKFHDNEKVR